jgi:hypothetical protein
MGSKLFEDLEFSPEDSAALKLKTDLHTKVVKRAARYSQKQPQRGKMSKFSLKSWSSTPKN